MRNRIRILVVIMLIIGGFSSKKKAEVVVIEHMEQVNKRIQVDVVIHKVWSKRQGLDKFEVYVDYTANNWLRLVSKYKVIQGQVVSSERVSP